MSDRPTDADAPGTAGAHDDLSGPVADAEALSDDDILEAEAVAEGDPSDDPYVGADDEVSSDDEQVFVDGTPGRSDLAAERDEYLEALQRVKAEFDNFKKRTAKERVDLATRANAQLVEKLLPVFDAFDAAVEHGASDVEPIYKSLLDVLEKEGLERMAPEGQPLDPNLHEAVMHEPGDGGEPEVVEVLRTGWSWKGVVLRAAMVKVKG